MDTVLSDGNFNTTCQSPFVGGELAPWFVTYTKITATLHVLVPVFGYLWVFTRRWHPRIANRSSLYHKGLVYCSIAYGVGFRGFVFIQKPLGFNICPIILLAGFSSVSVFVPLGGFAFVAGKKVAYHQKLTERMKSSQTMHSHSVSRGDGDTDSLASLKRKFSPSFMYAINVSVLILYTVLTILVMITSCTGGEDCTFMRDNFSQPSLYWLVTHVCIMVIFAFKQDSMKALNGRWGVKREYITTTVIGVIPLGLANAWVVFDPYLGDFTNENNEDIYLPGFMMIDIVALLIAFHSFYYQAFLSYDKYTKSMIESFQGSGLSLEEILDHKQGKHFFVQYCREILAAENILFYEEVEKYEQGEADEKTARKIMKKYIEEDSVIQVNIDGTTRQEVERRIAHFNTQFSRYIFQEAKEEIATVMRDSILPRFKATEEYKSIVEYKLNIPPAEKLL